MSYTCGKCMSLNHQPGPCECCGNGADRVDYSQPTFPRTDICFCAHYGATNTTDGKCLLCGKSIFNTGGTMR